MSKFNKKAQAVALKYQEETDVAPVVIASGSGINAEKIIEIAELKGIPVFRDDSVASLMCMLNVGRPIPPELYQVVAVIYSQLMKISNDIKHFSDAVPQPRRSTPKQIRQQLQERIDNGSKN